MKVYKGTGQTKKSWAIELTDDGRINAVDAVTGKVIACLIVFEQGVVRAIMRVNGAIEYDGYDPFEHGNKFDEEGRIVIN